MHNETSKTFWCKIYIAGPINEAKQIIRKECLREGLCVNITSTDFIYTGGEEVGYVVELINYPRFPKSEDEIYRRAIALSQLLLEGTYQHSILIMTPSLTQWISKREQ